jgi:hypothetical protein
MKLKLQPPASRKMAYAFTLVDALFAIAAAGVMFLALYAGLAFGFNVIKMSRENTRATQIMLEKMETIRLYRWEQITNVGFIDTNSFTIPYYSIGGTNTSLLYTCQVSIGTSGVKTDTGLPCTYADDMRKVTVRLDWSRIGATNRTRTMSTLVSRNGMQSYVYY